jgi:transposase
VDKIAKYMKCNKETVRRTIHRWKEKRLGGLYSKKGSGRKKKWSDEDLQVIEDKLESERSYNSKQLCKIWKAERNIEMSERQMRRILKKNNYVWKRTKISLTNKQDRQKRAFKKADLEMLEWAASVGEIHLKYTDESGFALWSGVQFGQNEERKKQ